MTARSFQAATRYTLFSGWFGGDTWECASAAVFAYLWL